MRRGPRNRKPRGGDDVLRTMRGLAYMYAARTGAERNSARNRKAAVGGGVTALTIYICTGSLWWACIPFTLFGFLMLVDALRGVRRFRAEMRAAKRARQSPFFGHMYPNLVGRPVIPPWARGSGGGAYGFLIGLYARAEDYATHWPGILGWKATKQASLSSITARVKACMASELYANNKTGADADDDSRKTKSIRRAMLADLASFPKLVQKPLYYDDILGISDVDATSRTIRVANMAWYALYGPKELRHRFVAAMAEICGSGDCAPDSDWENIHRKNTEDRKPQQRPRRRRRKQADTDPVKDDRNNTNPA